MRHRVEQAVFSSQQNPDRDGYQVIAASERVSGEMAQALAQIAPSHDALLDLEGASWNGQWLRDPHPCCVVSVSRAVGREYSGRGQAIATRFFLADPQTFRAFGNHPFRLIEACAAVDLEPQLRGDRLPALELLGGANDISLPRLRASVEAVPTTWLLRLVDALLTEELVAAVCPVEPRKCCDAAWMLLPAALRGPLTLSTGLRFSERRRVRLFVVPGEGVERRRAARRGAAVIGEQDRPLAHAWPRLVRHFLEAGELASLAELIDGCREPRNSTELAAWAENLLTGV